MNKFPVNRAWNLNKKPQNAYYTYRQISLSLLTAGVLNLFPTADPFLDPESICGPLHLVNTIAIVHNNFATA